ncbi:MAG: hypothetical protein HRT47_10200 [Candidatus Caenarcaniphilales bacterium]|nr:hypothetical protein [Candidatus Caenarcaniphilales bacterium]
MINLFGAKEKPKADMPPGFQPIGSEDLGPDPNAMDSKRVPKTVGEEALRQMSMPPTALNNPVGAINSQSKLLKFGGAGFPESVRNALKGLGLKQEELAQFRAFESDDGKYVVFAAPDSNAKEAEALGKALLGRNVFSSIIRTLTFADKKLENQVKQSLKDSNIKDEKKFKNEVIKDKVRIQLIFDTVDKNGNELKKATLNEATYSLSAYDLVENSKQSYKKPLEKIAKDLEGLVESSSNPQNKEDLKLFMDAFVKDDKKAIEELEKKASHIIMIEALSKLKDSNDTTSDILEMSTDGLGVSYLDKELANPGVYQANAEVILAGAASHTTFTGQKEIKPMQLVANGKLVNQTVTKVSYGTQQSTSILKTLLETTLALKKDQLINQKSKLDEVTQEAYSKAILDNVSNVLLQENQQYMASMN